MESACKERTSWSHVQWTMLQTGCTHKCKWNLLSAFIGSGRGDKNYRSVWFIRKHRKVNGTETPRSCANCHHVWCDGDTRPFRHQNPHPRGNLFSLYASPRPGNQPEVDKIQKKARKYSLWSKEIRKKEFILRTQKNN